MFRRLFGRTPQSVSISKLRVSDDYPFRPFDKKRGVLTGTIEVHSKNPDAHLDPEEPTLFEWIDLRDVPEHLKRLQHPREVVLPKGDLELVIDYPLGAIALAQISATRPISRQDLIVAIRDVYAAIYDTESESQSRPTPAPGDRGLWLNRPPSDGAFKIGGHDFNDLGLHCVEVYDVSGTRVLYPQMFS